MILMAATLGCMMVAETENKYEELYMLLVKPSFEVLQMSDINLIEIAGRTCYKSEDKITADSAGKFVKMLDEKKHHAMIEHSFASVRVICDRGVTHEIVRHRLFAFAQESTRYCNYGKAGQVKFIIPPWVKIEEGEYNPEWDGCLGDGRVDPFEHGSAESWWFWHCAVAERDYLKLLAHGWQPQQARSVLPNSLKTEIVISGNFREWKHFFSLRTATAAHPQMQEIAIPICEEFEKRIPEIAWR